MTEIGYALDLLTPVRYVVTTLEGAAPAALTVGDMAAGYEHSVRADYSRIRKHENCANDGEARRWLLRRAVTELGKQVEGDDETGWKLAVPFDNLKYPGRESFHRFSDDPELDLPRATQAAYVNMREGRPFHVKVAGGRGAIRERRLQLHPLAMALPLVKEKEFDQLVEDARANGLHEAVHVWDDQLLDGRHRVAIATVLGIPVRVVEFTGTTDEAQALVMSLNYHRRHLTMPQKAEVVRAVFLPEAETGSAAQRQKETVGRPSKSVANVPPISDGGLTAAEVAVGRSGLDISPRSVRALAPLDDAPITREKVRSGEIKSVQKARKAALEEINSAEPATYGPSESAWSRLGKARTELQKALESLDRNESGSATAEEHHARSQEIRDMLDKYDSRINEQTGQHKPRSDN